MARKTVIDLYLHPVRLRILRAFSGQVERTTRDLAAALNDVPQATLYRHLKRLTEAGILGVSKETPVRGALERAYRIDPAAMQVPVDDIEAITAETHLKYFSVFLASLLEDFGRYIHSDDANVGRDDAHYLQMSFGAAPAEFADFMKEFKALVERTAKRGPAKNRVQRTLSIVTFPDRPKHKT